MNRLLSLTRLLLVLLLVLPGLARASVTAGTIKGTTVDEGGLPIPGVLVTIRSDNLMGVKQQETDGDGRFFFPELPPGIYELTAEKPGFAKVVRPNLQVNIGRNTILTVEMPLQEAGEEIVVEETRPVVDTESSQRGSVLTKEFLERIPAGRSYQSATQMAAGVTGGSNPNIGGASYNENTYLLDGVNITDPVTGTFSLNFNFDAIEQVEVLTNAFDPEYGYNLGGAINVVTESGGNVLEFEGNIYYTNGTWAPKLDARYASDGYQLAPTDFDSRYESIQAGVKISGPIIRDKAWFIASYQHSRSLIANVGIDLPRDFDGHYVLAKLTVQPTPEHRFTLLTQTNPSTIDNMDQSDRYVQPEAQSRQYQGGFVTSLGWDWFISPETFLETDATMQKLFLEGTQVPCTHDQDLGYNPCDPTEPENHIDLTTPGRFGINNAFDSENYPFFDFDDRWRWSIGSKFSLLQVEAMGSHDMKVGISYDSTLWNRTFGYTGQKYYYDLNELAYNPDTLKNYYWLETTGPVNFKATADNLGMFIQDVYKPIDNLTFRFGTRYDRAWVRNDVGEAIINVGLWGPRFSVIWDPWANNKSKIVGSVGRFNDSGRLAVPYYLSQSGFGQKLFLGEYFDQFGYPGYSEGIDNAYAIFPNENTNTVLDGTIAPHSDEFSVGAERELIRDLAAQLYFTGKYTRNLYAFDETNLIWDEDGYNVLGSSDGSLTPYSRLRTPNIARRDYFRTDLSVNKLWSDRWQVQANYSYTISRGTVQNTPSGFLSVPQQVEYYVNGLLYTDVRHDIAAGFAWDIPNDPWTTQLGGTLMYESGNPESRYYGNGSSVGYGSILRQTIGTYAREEPWWSLSILLQQSIPVRKGKLVAVAELQNATNNRQGDSAYISSDNRWIISGRQDPMQISLGARYEF
ncbi:MAG: TonB-dependent receptor [Deltaproteobacteria bacterium]|nr:MAG: TonB-dependent receptor [Deltaproteobacteria bacterium]